MIDVLTHAVVAGFLTLGTMLGIYQPPAPEPVNLGTDTVLPIAGATYTLSGGGVSSSATSLTLSSFTIPQNGYKIQDSDISDTFYLTLEPGNRSRQEIVSCTTVTQNSGGTATLSGCTRGLSPITPYTASSSLQFAHGGGSQVIFSDPPQLFDQFPAKANDETITGQWTFSTFPVTPSNSAASETVAGIVELATGAEGAASTQSGAVGRLALGANLATSTYNRATAPNIVVMTKANGSIDLSFLGTTTIALPATTTIAGSLTLSGGTSNIASSSIIAYMSSTTPTQTWTKPSNLKYVKVIVQGPGGQGGIGNSLSYAGGGGGGYGVKVIPASALGSTETVTVGGGATQISSSFGSHITCAAGNDASGNTPGTGGSCTNADWEVDGGSGAQGASIASFYTGGAGGDSVLGFGGVQVWNTSATGIARENGTGNGGGGGGCASATDGNPSCDQFASNAADGSQGAVIVYQYFY